VVAERQTKLLEKILSVFEKTADCLSLELTAPLDKPLIDKNQVMDYLKISDAAYRWSIRSGRLSLMGFDQIDWYRKRDASSVLEKNQRKGRQ